MTNAPIRDFNWSHRRATDENDGRLPHGLSAALPEDVNSLPQAIIISGAGAKGANGTYRKLGREKCGAPVYKHMELDAAFSIMREPHTNKKTGKTKHGWLLSEAGSPLYGVPTESLIIPSSGWKAFNGSTPVPAVERYRCLAEAMFVVADASGLAGEEAAERSEWQAAVSAFDSALVALGRSGDRFGEPFERRAAWLFSRRAEASAKLEQYHSALRDAIAALELVPALERARLVAVEAAKALGCRNDQDALELLEAAGAGQILDRGAPLHLQNVEKWVEEAIRVAKFRVVSEPEAPPEAEAAPGQSPGPAPKAAPVPAPPVIEVDPEYHRGFMHWINFLRADPLEEDMFREDWAEMVGQKLSSLNWKYSARRVGVDTTGDSRTEAVLKLMAAYESAGKPPGPPLPKSARCEAEHLLTTLAHTVHKVQDERLNLDNIDPTAAGVPACLRIPIAKSLKPLN
mmetsp:Transcript_104786/g.305982  ORF Transcript_104786/g.305982 Transcript_104786/m.305982 type:complete len:459 (+) Transcript_104786:67-1443(+)